MKYYVLITVVTNMGIIVTDILTTKPFVKEEQADLFIKAKRREIQMLPYKSIKFSVLSLDPQTNTLERIFDAGSGQRVAV